MYNDILLRHKKEGIRAIRDNIKKPVGHYAKSNKPERERQIMYSITYMWNLKQK